MTEGPRKDGDGSLPQSYSIPTRPVPATTPSSDNISAGLGGMDPNMLPSGAGPPSDPTLLGSGIGPSIGGEELSWEMIGLGLEEPLPLQDTINDL